MATYDFDKYLKEILDFSNDNETYNNFLIKHKTIEEIVMGKSGVDGIYMVMENEKYRNILKEIFDLYDKAPIDFKYARILRYLSDLSTIASIKVVGYETISSFEDVMTMYDKLKKEWQNSFKSNSKVFLNIFMEALRLVLMSYKTDIMRVHDLPWLVKRRLEEYLHELDIDGYVSNPYVLNDMKKFIKDRKIVLPYFYNEETYYLNLEDEFEKYVKYKSANPNYNGDSTPKM